MFIRMLLLTIFSFSLYSAPKKIIAAAYESKTYKRPTIVLDAGHGGIDRGAKIKYPYLEEKRLTLSLTLLAKRQLEQMGYKVILTRAKDYFVPLKKRVSYANNLNAEMFISIHFNSCPNKQAHGVEVYYYNSQENKKRAKSSKNLAQSTLTTICKKTNAKSRGVKNGRFVVIKETKMPAVLIEVGFLTNPQERDNIRKKVYLEKVSKGISEGVDNFIKKYV